MLVLKYRINKYSNSSYSTKKYSQEKLYEVLKLYNLIFGGMIIMFVVAYLVSNRWKKFTDYI
jgi:hypothetical protein